MRLVLNSEFPIETQVPRKEAKRKVKISICVNMHVENRRHRQTLIQRLFNTVHAFSSAENDHNNKFEFHKPVELFSLLRV